MQALRLFSSAAYRAALLTCAIFFASGLTIAAIGPSLPILATRLEADLAALGGLFTAFSVGVIVVQAGLVRASKRFGQRAILAVSMLLMAMGSFGIAQGTSLLTLFAAALVGGIGFGGVLATGNTLIAQLFPERSAAALNGINLFFGIGSIVGPSLAAATNARLGMPQLVLWLGALTLLLLLPLVLGMAAPGVVGAMRGVGRVRRAPAGNSWLLGLLLLVYIGTEIGFGAWLTLYMVLSANLDVASAALVVSGFWLALTSGRGLAVLFGARLSTYSLLRLCLLGLLLGAVLLALSIGNLGLTLAGVLLFGLSCGPVFPTVLALVASSAGGGAAASRALALGNGGGIVVPALMGLLLTRVGPPAVSGLLLVAALLMIGLGALAMRPAAEMHVTGEADCTPAG